MKKFTYDVIKQPSLSNRLELKTHVLVENHIDDLIYLHIIANNKLLDMVILHPFQKKLSLFHVILRKIFSLV